MERALTIDDDLNLPSGWERFDDEQGVYYWHKQTGTVTRDRPESMVNSPSLTLSSCSSSNDICFENNSLLYKSESDNSIRTSDSQPNQHRFHVCSLGWTNMHEDDLTKDKSSRSVNRCIYELTNGINDSICRWGDGKDLYMDINNRDILLIDPIEMTILHKQSIPSIRVWGVGRDNSRDFAYVAKDRMSNVYKCHVFRCDNTSARVIATILHDICRNLMIERGLLNPITEHSNENLLAQKRPTSFPESIESDMKNISFPTPMEEQKKNISCKYLGCIYVEKPGGMDVLRPAIENLAQTVPTDRWLPVDMHISPTSIIVCSDDESKDQLLDCRIRYLSFLGVGQDTNYCGFIIHCADNSFKCHVFYCQPSCVQLCKNIEAACKLRYQKCLDAHPQPIKPITPSKSYGAQIKSLVESFWFGNK